MLSCSDFAKHALKLELYPKQAEILNSFFTGGYTQATWALGRRCVTGDTLVPTRRGMIEIGSLRGLGAPVRTVDGDGWSSLGLDVAQPHGGAANAVLFYDGGVQKIKRLRTALGIELRGTPNHPVMTLDKGGIVRWKQLDQIEPGDYLALRNGSDVWPVMPPDIRPIIKRCKESLQQSATAFEVGFPAEIDKDFAYALGMLVGDGTWNLPYTTEITGHVDDLSILRPHIERGLQVAMTKAGDKRNPNILKIQKFSKYYRLFLHELGYKLGTKRDEKRVPWAIMQSPKKIVCNFLSGFFDADGCVEKGNKITFSTASEKLARDIQALLFNIGILCKVTNKQVNGKTYWIGTLIGLESRQIFASEIGFRLPRKQWKALQSLENVDRDGGHSQRIPYQKHLLKQLLAQVPSGSGIKTSFRDVIGNAIKNGGEHFNARRLPGLVKLINDHELEGQVADHFRTLLEHSFIFDEVKEIDNAGEEEVYDFHVPGSNAFVGNGVCQHNSGKTLMAAVACVYICFVLEDKYKRKVRKGEKWYVLTVANSQDQSRIALNNIRQLILDSPFAKEIVRETADQLEISNNCVFKAIPTSGRAARGLACCACVFDELAFAVDGDANSGGKGIYDALSPAVAQFGKNGKILELSSPWLTDGLFYQHFKEAASGRFPNLQAVNLPTWEMNPTISKEFLDLERQRDPDKFKVEYGAQFANNLSALISSDVVDACVDDSRHALPPIEAFIGSYVLSLDPARGGLGRDNYTACIVHFEGNTLVVDKFHTFMADFEINGRKEVNIVAVEDWIKEQHKLYLFDKIVMDQYNSAGTIQNLSGEYPIEELTWTISSKVKAFSKMRELFNGGLVQLYNHEKAINEIKNLTVVYRAGGQWTVTGGKQTGIDDHAFALAAAIHAADREDDVNWLQDFL